MNITVLSILGSLAIIIILGGLVTFLSHRAASLHDPVKVWHALNKPVIRRFRPLIYSYLLSFANPFSSCIRKYNKNFLLFTWTIMVCYYLIIKKIFLEMRITTLDKGFCSGVLKVFLYIYVYHFIDYWHI